MKKILFLLCLIGGTFSTAFAQNSNPWPTSGNVGIGTSTPTLGLLHIVGNGFDLLSMSAGGGQPIQLNAYTNLDFRIVQRSNAPMTFWTNTVERLRIDQNGNLGIGTTSPSSYFHGGTNKVLEIFNSNTTLNSQSHVILSTGSTLDGSGGGTISWVSKNSTGNQGMAYIGSQIQGSASTNAAANLVFGVSSGSGIVAKMVLDKNGNLGVGTSAPSTKLHIVGTGSSIDVINPINGEGFAIQANSGSRSATIGAQLEFVIPANTDGTNAYGQGRIITVAGSAGNTDATGKMIIGTRRAFNKLGTGANWYYGNDIVIDGAGNVGIGTLTPREALSVNGNIRSKQVKVETANWPDYVFKKSYTLPPLSELNTYIITNQHLPEMPSAADITKDGQDLGEINKLLLKKVEELTLYLIEKDKQVIDQQKTNKSLQEQIDFLMNQLKLKMPASTSK